MTGIVPAGRADRLGRPPRADRGGARRPGRGGWAGPRSSARATSTSTASRTCWRPGRRSTASGSARRPRRRATRRRWAASTSSSSNGRPVMKAARRRSRTCPAATRCSGRTAATRSACGRGPPGPSGCCSRSSAAERLIAPVPTGDVSPPRRRPGRSRRCRSGCAAARSRGSAAEALGSSPRTRGGLSMTGASATRPDRGRHADRFLSRRRARRRRRRPACAGDRRRRPGGRHGCCDSQPAPGRSPVVRRAGRHLAGALRRPHRARSCTRGWPRHSTRPGQGHRARPRGVLRVRRHRSGGVPARQAA